MNADYDSPIASMGHVSALTFTTKLRQFLSKRITYPASWFAYSAITLAFAASMGDEPALATTWGFNSAAEGWQIVSYPFRGHNPTPVTSPLGFDSTVGLPPGSVRVGDIYAETGIAAPNAVLGNRLDLYGQELSYDILIRFTDNATYPAISLNGGSMSVYYDRPSPQLNAWTHVTIPLTETGWRVAGSQVPATQSQFQSVLSTLNGLYLYTEWHTGGDDTNVDNISLGADIDLLGDFNGDGSVDAADYVVWRKNPDGTLLPEHYDLWRTHFGRTNGNGNASSSNTAVPEPPTTVLFLIACVCVARVFSSATTPVAFSASVHAASARSLVQLELSGEA